jgi:hypothetical protein
MLPRKVARVPVDEVIDAYLSTLHARRLAPGEWGLTLPEDTGGGWPLEIGLRLSDGLLRVQAFAATAEHAPDDAELLHWNRHSRIVRLGRTRDGDIWIHADLPLEAVDERRLDQVMGLVVEAALEVRAPQRGAPAGGGWLRAG